MESVRSFVACQLVRLLVLCLVITLAACDGSSRKTSLASSASSSSANSFSSASSISSSATTAVTISGKATYDFVPYHNDFIGLDYDATRKLPIRGAIVELVDGNNEVIAQTVTDESGSYSFASPRTTLVRVRVNARLLRTTTPGWNISITDNTNSNALYILVGSLTDSGDSNSQRHLHAASGWGGAGYTGVRAAAPFAIMDTIYTGLLRLAEAGNRRDLGPLELRWSSENITVPNPNNDYSTGEIGTSFFAGDAIYLLGQADVDTDEYDSHVVLHEWTHYLESALARSDTIGGAHGYGDRLDIRVAHSEGLANAMAAMILDDEYYRDSGGVQQAGGYAYDISDNDHVHAGWYNEASVESILYNYYISSSKKISRDLSYVFQAFSAEEYRRTVGFISIHLFVAQLQILFPDHAELLDELLDEQQIYGRGAFAEGEINSAGYDPVVPVYKILEPNTSPINVCSSSHFGKYNKLGVAQYLRIEIQEAGSYQFRIIKNGGNSLSSDPDFFIFERGELVIRADSTQVDQEEMTIELTPGQYLLEVFDWNNRDKSNSSFHSTCFDVQVTQ